jgi:hypothetical protein
MGRPRKYPLDTVQETVLDSDQNEPIPPRVQGDLINIRRQLKSALSYIEMVLRQRGVKV